MRCAFIFHFCFIGGFTKKNRHFALTSDKKKRRKIVHLVASKEQLAEYLTTSTFGLERGEGMEGVGGWSVHPCNLPQYLPYPQGIPGDLSLVL